jgi:hypothetical protein
LGTTTRCNAAANKATKNKSTSTKESAAVQTNNQNNNVVTAEKQQQQRAGTPPYTQKMVDSQKQIEARGDKLGQPTKQTQKTSKSVEPQGQKSVSTGTSSIGKEGKQSKKRLYKSASTNEICAAGAKCKGDLNNKALVALGHFNKALLNSDEFDYMKDRCQEEEELLPDQIQNFLKHVGIFEFTGGYSTPVISFQLSEGDKNSSRLKEQLEKLELLASPFDKRDTFLEGLMKLSPEEADVCGLSSRLWSHFCF